MTPEISLSPHQLLAFYLEAGVDCALMDEPLDRMVMPEEIAPAAAAPRQSPLAPAQPPRPITREVPPSVAIEAAEQCARQAQTLDELKAAMAAFSGCPLKDTATKLVFADGNPAARIMFIGEAPDYDDDIEGKPFLGNAGVLFDRMLAAIGLDRTNAYLTTCIPWRPPGGRSPNVNETKICMPFIRRHIELAGPEFIVTLGNPVTQTLLETRDGIMKTHGQWATYQAGERSVRAIATFNPGYLLQNPIYKRLAWQDLQLIDKALKGEATALTSDQPE